MPHIDFADAADFASVQANPHKGWYYHWFDNCLDKYPLVDEAPLLACPGLGLIYLRVPWCDLEPAEGDFRWELLDGVIERWAKRGVRFALRLTCRESSYDFATPEWVVQAGARGGRVEKEEWGRKPWQPDWGCPIFLAKLERFHRAAAEHWLRHPAFDHLDLGSYGTWGEGHTWPAATPPASVPVLLQHLDLHRRCWPGAQLVVTDEWLTWGRSREETEVLTAAMLATGVTLRDDSLLVDSFIHGRRDTATIMYPGLFDAFWRLRPTILEHEHYGTVVKEGNWRGRNGSEFGAHLVRRALELTHATWNGWHGWAADWLKDNPDLTAEIANRVGYWYFLESVDLPVDIAPGATLKMACCWRNRGVAPAYRQYPLQIRLRGPGGERILTTSGSDNRLWRPDSQDNVLHEQITTTLPADLAPGDYELALRLSTQDVLGERPIRLALRAERRDADGWYAIGRLSVTSSG